MVDTGSAINLIKRRFIKSDVSLDNENIRSLQGFCSETMLTLGSVQIYLFNEPTEFHVISDSINLPYDGVLGNTFFEDRKSIIDYKNKCLHLEDISIPLDFDVYNDNINYITVAQRSSVIDCKSSSNSTNYSLISNNATETPRRSVTSTSIINNNSPLSPNKSNNKITATQRLPVINSLNLYNVTEIQRSPITLQPSTSTSNNLSKSSGSPINNVDPG